MHPWSHCLLRKLQLSNIATPQLNPQLQCHVVTLQLACHIAFPQLNVMVQVLLYLIRLADVCGIDLTAAV